MMKSKVRIYSKNNPEFTNYLVNLRCTPMEKFIQRLKEEMQSKSIKAAELARRSGITKQNIGRLLNFTPHPITGATPTTTRETVEKLAVALGWDLDEALNLAGFASEHSEIPKPKNVAEFVEALERMGVTDWSIPGEDLNKLPPEAFEQLLDLIETNLRVQLKKVA